jgi:hypothetical protein
VDYDQIYTDADLMNGLPIGLTKSIAGAETGHIKDDRVRNRVRSPAGAVGRMQFMPATGQRFGLRSESDLTDPAKAIPAAGQYLGQLFQEFGRPELAAAAYNAGEGAVRKYGGVPPYKETQKYVPRVMNNLASVQHAHSMLQKYSPSFAQKAADFFIPPAYGADQPQGPGVMRPDVMSELDAIEQEYAGAASHGDVMAELDAIEQEYGGAPQSGMSPTLQANLRSMVKGLSAPVTMAMDAVNAVPNLIAKGVNTVRPGTMDYLAPGQSLVDKGLRSAGINPEPQSGAERAVTAALGAAVGSPLFGAASLASAPSQSLGAAASSAAASAGLPLPVQIAAGMVPGMAGGAVSGIVQGAGRLAGSLTSGGKESAAGRILNKMASAPMVAVGRAGADDLNAGYLPGSQPTLAEVTQDPGLARLQGAMPSSQAFINAGVDQVNALRRAQLDGLIHETLDRVNKVPKGEGKDVIEAIGKVKDRIYSQFGEQLGARGMTTESLPVQLSQTMERLTDLARSTKGNPNLQKVVNDIAGQLGDETPSFQQVWNTRQYLDDLIYEKWATSAAGSRKDLKIVGEKIRGAMNADLVAAAPEFQPFLSRYARMARAEGRLNLGRDVAAGLENAGRHVPAGNEAYGRRFISDNKADNLDQTISKASKKQQATLSKPQREAFNAVREEKRRAKILEYGGAPGNSKTEQNRALNQIITDDVLGAILGDTSRSGVRGAVRNVAQTIAGGPVGFLTKAAENDILRMIAAGLIDPKEGARLMQKGQLSGTEDFISKLNRSGQQGLLSEIYSNMVR